MDEPGRTEQVNAGPETQVLVFYSAKHNGLDGFSLAIRVGESYGCPFKAIECSRMGDVLVRSSAVEKIILIDCITEYLANRLKVIGRPWVCAISSVFADLYALYRTGLTFGEMNIHYIISNCRVFVDKFPEFSRFSYRIFTPKELGSLEEDNSDHFDLRVFGCRVPNVEDRDWCLVYMVKGVVPSDMHVFVDERHHRLPNTLDDIVVTGIGLSSPLWKAYIPAPRIIDYRAGVIPYEILDQLGRRVPVITIDHQVLRPITPYIYAARNMKEFSGFLDSAIQDPSGFAGGRPSVPAEFTPKLETVRGIMDEAFQAWEGKNENPS